MQTLKKNHTLKIIDIPKGNKAGGIQMDFLNKI